MSTLDLYKKRRHTTVKLYDHKQGKTVEFKVPNEYTVEEVERLLEIQGKRHELELEELAEKEEARNEQMQKFWHLIFDQLEVMFQHYQPEIDAEYLRGLMSTEEALEMLGWFQEHRQLRLTIEQGKAQKKNLN